MTRLSPSWRIELRYTRALVEQKRLALLDTKRALVHKYLGTVGLRRHLGDLLSKASGRAGDKNGYTGTAKRRL